VVVARAAQRHGTVQLLAAERPLYAFVRVTAARDQVVPGAPLHDTSAQPARSAALGYPLHTVPDCTLLDVA
jgi:hypothetical protein